MLPSTPAAFQPHDLPIHVHTCSTPRHFVEGRQSPYHPAPTFHFGGEGEGVRAARVHRRPNEPAPWDRVAGLSLPDPNNSTSHNQPQHCSVPPSPELVIGSSYLRTYAMMGSRARRPFCISLLGSRAVNSGLKWSNVTSSALHWRACAHDQ